MNYQKTIEVIGQKNLDEYDYVLDINKLEDSEIWKNIFEFCSENLSYIGEHYRIEKPIFFFIDDDEINAYSYKVNDDYLIVFHYGLIDFLKNKLFVIENTKLIKLQGEFETFKLFDISKYLFANAIQFIYYHELGHTIQQIFKFSSERVDEKFNPNNIEFDINDHLKEYDSDNLATNCVLAHAKDNFMRLNNKFQNNENLENILALSLSSILFVFLSFIDSSKRNEIIKNCILYYEEKKHPHCIIRIAYILDCFLTEKNADIELRRFNIDKFNILNKSFLIVGILFDSNDLKNSFSFSLTSNWNNIQDYNYKLYNYCMKEDKLAVPNSTWIQE